MTRKFGIVCVAMIAIAVAGALGASAAGRQAQAPSAAAAAAAKASPALVTSLAKEIDATPEQAAGAAGALFAVAKTKLSPQEFSQVSSAVPGMASLLKAAPSTGGALPASLSQVGGSASGMASAASAFSTLGLSPDKVGKAVPVLTSFVSKSGGANVGNLLAGALK